MLQMKKLGQSTMSKKESLMLRRHLRRTEEMAMAKTLRLSTLRRDAALTLLLTHEIANLNTLN